MKLNRQLSIVPSADWGDTAPTDAAANDSSTELRARYQVTDASVLVTRVVGHVAARVGPANVDIELQVASREILIEGDPVELAFAISGVLGAEVRAIDSEDGGLVRVTVGEDQESATITMTADEPPPLVFVRAVGGTGEEGDVDPTVAHCRRIIERRGGTITLAEHEGRIGFDIRLPHFSTSAPVRLLPHSPARQSHDDVRLRLVA